jgi:Rieske Fe-S protein
MAGSHHISRRDFIKLMTFGAGGVIAAGIGLPAIDYLIDPALRKSAAEAWIPLGPLENFVIGKPTLVNFTRSKVNGWERTANSYGIFVVRKSETEALAFSNVCTHLGCRVNWSETVGGYICPCHDAEFGPDGSIVRGPQPRPLDGYTLEAGTLKVEEGVVSILFTEG